MLPAFLLQQLQKLELAYEVRPGQWILRDDVEVTLRAMGERGDIVRTMQRAMGSLQRELAVFEPGKDLVLAELPADPMLRRFVEEDVKKLVERRIRQAVDAGVDGVVASDQRNPEPAGGQAGHGVSPLGAGCGARAQAERSETVARRSRRRMAISDQKLVLVTL